MLRASWEYPQFPYVYTHITVNTSNRPIVGLMLGQRRRPALYQLQMCWDTMNKKDGFRQMLSANS